MRLRKQLRAAVASKPETVVKSKVELNAQMCLPKTVEHTVVLPKVQIHEQTEQGKVEQHFQVLIDDAEALEDVCDFLDLADVERLRTASKGVIQKLFPLTPGPWLPQYRFPRFVSKPR